MTVLLQAVHDSGIPSLPDTPDRFAINEALVDAYETFYEETK